MPRFEVDVLVQEPVTVVVEAEDRDAAREAALDGRGVEQRSITYIFGEVVDVREVPDGA